MSTHNMFLWRNKENITEALLMSTHLLMCFCGEIKNIHLVPSPIWSYGPVFRVYHINPKYTDILTPCQTYPKFEEVPLIAF